MSNFQKVTCYSEYYNFTWPEFFPWVIWGQVSYVTSTSQVYEELLKLLILQLKSYTPAEIIHTVLNFIIIRQLHDSVP